MPNAKTFKKSHEKNLLTVENLYKNIEVFIVIILQIGW